MRRRGQVAAIACAHIGFGPIANKRPGDHATDVVLIDELPRNVAELVKALKAEGLLMAGYLKNAVRRRVKNRFACFDVLITELGNNRRARRVTITEIAGQIGPLHELFEQFLRKSILTLREVAPVEQDRHAGYFPVAAGRVLAARQLLGEAIRSYYFSVDYRAWRKIARAVTTRMEKTQPREVGQLQRALR